MIQCIFSIFYSPLCLREGYNSSRGYGRYSRLTGTLSAPSPLMHIQVAATAITLSSEIFPETLLSVKRPWFLLPHPASRIRPFSGGRMIPTFTARLVAFGVYIWSFRDLRAALAQLFLLLNKWYHDLTCSLHWN